MVIYMQIQHGISYYARQPEKGNSRNIRRTKKKVQEIAGGYYISTGARTPKTAKFETEAKSAWVIYASTCRCLEITVGVNIEVHRLISKMCNPIIRIPPIDVNQPLFFASRSIHLVFCIPFRSS